jgi:lipopolysaccharide export system protein LptA
MILVVLSVAMLCLGAERHSPQEGLNRFMPAQNCAEPAQALDVTSERMTFDSRTQTFLFEDNVQVRHCQMTMLCDRLQVAQDANGQRIERIIAMGNVRVQQGERHIRAERAEYVDAEQKLILTGNPRAWEAQEQNELTGEEMVVFLQEERLLVKRARVLFHPHPTSSISGKPQKP